MKIFRYWMVVPLDLAFHATFDVVPQREITEQFAAFEAVVEAIKKTGCEWEMIETSATVVEKSPHSDEAWPGRGRKHATHT